jgi:hypothetical protein
MTECPTNDFANESTPSPAGAALPQDDRTPSAAIRSRYQVVSVEQAPVPDGGQGTDWCRYVLSCGTSRITGLHRGTLDEVTAFATSCAEDFNLRSANGKGKAGVAYTKKKSLIPVAR